MREEKWLPILGYEELYEVSNQGRVRSLDRNFVLENGRKYKRKGKILAFNISKTKIPYRRVKLSKSGISKLLLVSRLVLTAFVGLPKKGRQACHNNSDPSDNTLQNLRWDTAKNNYLDRIANNTYPIGERNPNGKLTENAVKFIRNTDLSESELGRLFNVSPRYISNIRSRRTWKHVNG